MKLKQNKQSKLVIALSAVILLLVALSATLTFAYFTAKQEQTTGSSLNFGTLKIDTSKVEGVKFTKTDSCEGAMIVPGCTIGTTAKIVVLSEDTNIGAYIRIKMTVNSEEATITANNLLPGSKWAYAVDNVKLGEKTGTNDTEDVYLYYTEKVTKDTQIDFSDISFAVDVSNGNTLQGKTVTFKLTVEAIQAAHANGGTDIDLTNATTARDKAEAIARATDAWNAAKTQDNATNV